MFTNNEAIFYLHLNKEALINIPNVLDELNKTITLDWYLALRNPTIQQTKMGGNENQ